MKWLHISDFHIGGPRGPEQVVFNSLLDTINTICKSDNTKIDAVFISGDIAYSGKAEQYQKFTEDFLNPLKEISNFASAKFYSVPGNHDVDCDAVLPTSWQVIGQRNQERFFYENEEGIKTRRSRTPVFEAYKNFTDSNAIISPDPNSQVTLLCDEGDYPFIILACNTAFFSDRDIPSGDDTTPSPLSSLRHIIGNKKFDRPFIILSHHPIQCYFKDEQKPFETFLKEKNAVLFHGHYHRPAATFSSAGTLRTLGFGASYIGGLENKKLSPYKNSFAICSLEERLKVQCFSWDPFNGSWADTTSTDLNECYEANLISTSVPGILFPSVQGTTYQIKSNTAISTLPRTPPIPKLVIPLKNLGKQVIGNIVFASKNLQKIWEKGEPKIQCDAQNDGKIRFEFELSNDTRHILFLIVGVNHVLSSKEIESLNTNMDTEGLSSATIVSLGKISADAQSMYLRLSTRKPIEVIINENLASNADALLSTKQKELLTNLDAANCTTNILLGNEEALLLVLVSESIVKSFYIVNRDGCILPSNDSVVTEIRNGSPDFTNLSYYGGESQYIVNTPVSIFDEKTYLESCYHEYNVVKYAALANVGLKFSELPLEDLYVNATASEIGDDANNRFEQIVDDHLENYPLSTELKKHIQQQLLCDLGGSQQQEVSMAREFYQKYNAMLVIGDPGSGKTCFVKNEILEYTKSVLLYRSDSDKTHSDWHAHHIPVMVQLSELVAEEELSEKGILFAISNLMEKKGFCLPSVTLNTMVKEGKIAFFFDGLDEVVSIEKRAKVVELINNLIADTLSVGNRFVVTSRPAAVQLVNLLPTLHKLELQGLTNSQIKTLISKLLSMKIVEGSEGIEIDKKELSRKDESLINKLMEDCTINPGVARLAQNPLLLTLLVMVYANSGALSAKRHRIYEEAIKTLASVRGREAGHEPLSLQDLRERLGAIALSVYRKESGLLPSRNEVCEVVRATMERQRNEQVALKEANEFIQKVAESTGLIAIEIRSGLSDGESIVTFMHHSFLEYFAAIGLSKSLNNFDIGTLVNQPRWAEILTLLSGIIGESEDVAPILQKFIETSSNEYDVDAKKLIFAMDCALECEVPSETAQRSIMKCIINSLKFGPAKLDPWVRSEIGQRLGYIFVACGSKEFARPLADLINDSEQDVCAAAIDLLGYVFSDGCSPDLLLKAFNTACCRSDELVLSAICITAGRSTSLQNDLSLQVISKCLKKSKRNRIAAFEALVNIPSLAANHWTELLNGVDDSDDQICRLASKAAIQAGLNANLIAVTASRKDLLLRALSVVSEKIGRIENLHNRVQRKILESLIDSGLKTDRILGIRLLPLADTDIEFIYTNLMQILNNKSAREEVVAALRSLAWSHQTHCLITRTHLKVVIEWFKSGTTDVRIAAAALLGEFPNEIMAIQTLINSQLSEMEIDEYCQVIHSLSIAGMCTDAISTIFFNELSDMLTIKRKMTEINIKKLSALMDASRRIGVNAPTKLVNQIRAIVEDYHMDNMLQRKALLCYPAVTAPTNRIILDLNSICKRNNIKYQMELAQLPAIISMKCKQSFDSVLACITALPVLRASLLKLHNHFAKQPFTESLEYCITELRSGITELNQILIAFDDFIEKKNVDHEKEPDKVGNHAV